MSDYVEVITIVEGRTEQIFVQSILQPHLALKNVFISATQVSKPGQKGGDVKFSRTIRDIGNHLKQRTNTYVCTFIDYYGIKEWPGINKVPPQSSPIQIADVVNAATRAAVAQHYMAQRCNDRYIPYLAVHEFEALLFSCSETLSQKLDIDTQQVVGVLEECGEPEAINNSPTTAPSKRLDQWSKGGKFNKTTTGIAIARDVGVPAMRDKCPVFNAWLTSLELLAKKD